MTPPVIKIVAASLIGECKLRLEFDDGTSQNVDFKPFLSCAVHPDIKAYLEPQRFAAFRVEYGDLIWGDHDLCFPIIDLYNNQLDHGAILEAAA